MDCYVRVDDVAKPEELTEGWRQSLPVVSLGELAPECCLEGVEETVTEVGWTMWRTLLVERWRAMDKGLGADYRQRHLMRLSRMVMTR